MEEPTPQSQLQRLSVRISSTTPSLSFSPDPAASDPKKEAYLRNVSIHSSASNPVHGSCKSDCEAFENCHLSHRSYASSSDLVGACGVIISSNDRTCGNKCSRSACFAEEHDSYKASDDNARINKISRTKCNQKEIPARAMKASTNEIATSDEIKLLLSDSESSDAIVESCVTYSNEMLVTRTYYRRFWILFLFSFYSFFTCVQWNAWGPISVSMIAAFPGWSFGTIAWMEAWVTVMFLIFMLPICWVTFRFGFRTSILLSTIVLAIGLGLRCITDDASVFTLICHVSSIMLGFSTTIAFIAPSMVTSVWFPITERTTATAIVIASSQLGSVGSYLEPLLVHKPKENLPISVIKNDIMHLMYIMAIIAGILFILTLIYFPSKPPRPPTVASSIGRLNFKTGVMALLRNKDFITLTLVYGISSGPALGWVGMLNYSLTPLGFDQDEAMKVGLAGVLSCFVVSVSIGCLTDRIFGYLRETIIALLLLAATSFYWFLLLSHNIIPVVKWQVYASVSMGLGFHYATVTLFYELAAEMAYPASEVIVGGFVTYADCLATSIFLSVYIVNDAGYQWVTYVLVASNALPVVILLFIKDGYRRSKLDRTIDRFLC